MIYQDDRTTAQRETLTRAVVMTDSFMSGWGAAAAGTSVAAWACRPQDVDMVERWVRSRGEARRVRVVTLDSWRPRSAHVHVYAVEPGHPSLRAVE